ncbi:MAG: primosomal protein N', partial [Flavobacteriales bacterium]|nr:primosomal protein N' [Flavobacteriales bacterium]
MKQKKIYLDIILPLPVKGTFTYFTYDNLLIGQRVIVQFGARKIYTGIINSINFIKPVDYLAKEIIAIIDEMPIVKEKQLKFWSWMSDYYMCNIGEVMN